jgi:hydrogenase-4 membrane subunit HyfE
MSSILTAFVAVLLLPLFIASWRTSLLGLACQGLLMGWIAYRHHPGSSLETVLALVDLVGLRAIVAPVSLFRIQRSHGAARRNDVIPPNLLSWALALVLVVLPFQLAGMLVPQEGEQQTIVAVSAAALLLGFLVLATQSGPFSQMIGALRVENAIALFELGSEPHDEAVGIRIWQSAVLLVSILMFAWYLKALSAPTPEAGAVERSAL